MSGRLNYILWMQSLVDSTSRHFRNDAYDPSRMVTGLDIGTGASCIYPLLGCAQRPKWRFAATGNIIRNLSIIYISMLMYFEDIDDRNLHYARQNIMKNKLQARIRPFKARSDGPLMPLDELGLDR